MDAGVLVSAILEPFRMAKRLDPWDMMAVNHEDDIEHSLDPPSILVRGPITRKLVMPVRGSDPTTSAQAGEENAKKIQEEDDSEGKSQANRAKYEQSMFGFSSHGDRRTMSHAHTSAPAMSKHRQSEAGENQDDDGASFYSYNSTRDVRLFVKEMHGRCVSFVKMRLKLISTRIWNSMNETYMLPSGESWPTYRPILQR